MGKLKENLVEILYRNHLFIICNRLRLLSRKQSFVSHDSQKIFNKIYEEKYWESFESKSGGGSTIESTTTLRVFLPVFFQKFKIHSILDIPCGDYNWMKLVNKSNIDYIGADIVEKMIAKNEALYAKNNVSFEVLDLTKDRLPKVDLIFCKDCLLHLSYDHIWCALNNIKMSGSTYLLTTSYPLTFINYDILDGDYRSLNLRKKPFSFPKPILKVREKSKAIGNELDKTMYLWRIQDIPINKL